MHGHGPLQNFGFDFAVIHPVAVISRSAQPSVEGWETLREFHQEMSSEPSRLHHFSLNGNAGPDWADTEILDWSVFSPSVDAVMAVVGMISADLKSWRSVHVNCTQGSDRTGLVWGAMRLRYFGWTFDDMMAERALYLSAPLVDAVMDLAIVRVLKKISEIPRP